MDNHVKAQKGQVLIDFEFDSVLMDTVENALGDLKDKRDVVLQRAINKTARQARDALAEEARKTYTVKKGRFNKAMKLQGATQKKLSATIRVKGETLDTADFKTKKNSATKAAAAKILLSSSMTEIVSQKGSHNKAFFVKFKSGHMAIVQRDYDKESKYTSSGAKARIADYRAAYHAKHKRGKGTKSEPDLTRLNKMISNSVPKMVGGRVYEVTKSHIYSDLYRNIQAEVDRVLREAEVN